MPTKGLECGGLPCCCFFVCLLFFLKKEEPALVDTPIHHTLLYAKMFYKMGLAYSYTYRATETEPKEYRIEKKEMGLKRPQGAPPPVQGQLMLEHDP